MWVTVDYKWPNLDDNKINFYLVFWAIQKDQWGCTWSGGVGRGGEIKGSKENNISISILDLCCCCLLNCTCSGAC